MYKKVTSKYACWVTLYSCMKGGVCMVRQVQGPPLYPATSSYIQYHITHTSHVCPWVWVPSTSFCRSIRCKCRTTEAQTWLHSGITAQSQDCTGNTWWMESPLFPFSLPLFLLNKILGESQFCCMLHPGDTVTHSEFPHGLDMSFKNLLPNL